MKPESKIIRTLLGIIVIDQTYLTATVPLLTLIFFDKQSHLFSAETSYAVRSMGYGLCLTLPNIINLFFSPILSTLSDEIGRKKILILEVFNAALFTFLVGMGVFLGNLTFVFLGFLIKGAFARANPTANAVIGDTAPRNKKILYMGYLQFAISIGAALGPILGGYFASRYFFSRLNFAFPFFLASGLAIVNTIFVCWLMRETLPKVQSEKRWQSIRLSSIKKLILRPEILTISLVLLLIQLSWSTYYQFIPPTLKTVFHFSNQQLGFFIGTIAFWLALASSIGVKLLHTFFNSKQILLISILAIIVGLFITLLASLQLLPYSHIFIWLGAIPTAAGDVIAYSCITALFSNAVAQQEQGKIMAINFIIVSLAWSTTSLLGGFLLGISPYLPFMLAPLSVLAAFFFLRQRKAHQELIFVNNAA